MCLGAFQIQARQPPLSSPAQRARAPERRARDPRFNLPRFPDDLLRILPAHDDRVPGVVLHSHPARVPTTRPASTGVLEDADRAGEILQHCVPSLRESSYAITFRLRISD